MSRSLSQDSSNLTPIALEETKELKSRVSNYSDFDIHEFDENYLILEFEAYTKKVCRIRYSQPVLFTYLGKPIFRLTVLDKLESNETPKRLPSILNRAEINWKILFSKTPTQIIYNLLNLAVKKIKEIYPKLIIDKFQKMEEPGRCDLNSIFSSHSDFWIDEFWKERGEDVNWLNNQFLDIIFNRILDNAYPIWIMSPSLLESLCAYTSKNLKDFSTEFPDRMLSTVLNAFSKIWNNPCRKTKNYIFFSNIFNSLQGYYLSFSNLSIIKSLLAYKVPEDFLSMLITYAGNIDSRQELFICSKNDSHFLDFLRNNGYSEKFSAQIIKIAGSRLEGEIKNYKKYSTNPVGRLDKENIKSELEKIINFSETRFIKRPASTPSAEMSKSPPTEKENEVPLYSFQKFFHKKDGFKRSGSSTFPASGFFSSPYRKLSSPTDYNLHQPQPQPQYGPSYPFMLLNSPCYPNYLMPYYELGYTSYDAQTVNTTRFCLLPQNDLYKQIYYLLVPVPQDIPLSSPLGNLPSSSNVSSNDLNTIPAIVPYKADGRYYAYAGNPYRAIGKFDDIGKMSLIKKLADGAPDRNQNNHFSYHPM